jgi:hypothetical protein
MNNDLNNININNNINISNNNNNISQIKLLDNIINNYDCEKVTNIRKNKINSENTIIKKKSVKIISSNDFKIPKYNEYDDLNNKKYTLVQLKEICKYYKLKISGTKKVLIERCYEYLYYSFYTIKIQSCIRGYLIRKYLNTHGPALYNRKLCVNDTDFYTLDPIDTLPHYQFYSFEENGYIYGFDMCSLQNLFINNSILNPYTRQPIHKDVLTRFRLAIQLSNILGYKPILTLENDSNQLSPKQQQILRINNVFHEIDSLGNYSNSDWFHKLNRYQLVKFVRQLFDIWNYRVQINEETKRNIYPPFGNPFYNCNIQTIHLRQFEEILPDVITIIENFVTKGVDTQSKSLGAFYCLGALTIVSNDAAQALPWLYESFYTE